MTVLLSVNWARARSRRHGRIALTFGLLWCFGNPALANHPEGSCPDTHVDGGESIEGAVANYVTWERYTDGMQVPLGTRVVGTGHATAFGYCDKYIHDPQAGCVLAGTELRRVSAINAPARRQNRSGDSTSNGNPIYGNKQDFDAYAEHEWTNYQGASIPTILTYRFRNSIHETTCKIGASELWGKSITIYVLDENRCPTGDADSNAGNPCNAATGNKHQSETDYSSPGAGLSFVRSYNSQIPVDHGLGHGWISNHHKRLEPFANSMRLRRAHGGGDVFTGSGGVWSGPPDSAYTLVQDGTGYTVTQRDGSFERYDLNGRLLHEADLIGRTTTYTYHTNGKLLAVTGPWGHVMTFTYTTDGHLQAMIDPSLQVTTFTYDSNANLTAVTYPDTTARTYHYELSGWPYHGLTGITDENGNRYATFGYDSSSNAGKATFTQHAQTSNGQPQQKFSFTYNSTTQTTITGPSGSTEILTFLDRHGMRKLVSRIHQVDGKGIRQTWDANNNLLTRTDAEGRVTKYTYNATNQVVTMTEAFGTPQARTTAYEHVSPTIDLITRTSTPSAAPGQQREVVTHYNPNRTVSAIVTQGYQPNGTPVTRQTSMLYNAYGQVTQIDGPRIDVSDITLREYYQCTTGGECGQLKKVTNAAGHVTTYDTYDAHGRLTQMTDPNGLVTSYGYDLRGRLAHITEGPRVTSFTFDDAGQLQTTTAPDGKTLTYSYDAAHDLRSITDNFGNSISYAYDLRGNRTTEEIRDPASTLRKAVSATYDIRNRLDALNAAGSVTDLLFDGIGNLKQERDPNNNSTAHAYDSLNRLTSTTDALARITNYSYDTQNNVTLVQAPNGASTTYVYDDLGNLLQQTSPDTGTTSFTYDAAGNRTSVTDARGIVTLYTYDALNRQQTATYPSAGLNRAFSYDAGTTQIGRLTGWTDASGTTTQSFDLHGDLISSSRTISGHSFMVGYAYDTAGRTATITYPSSGRVVTYVRNALGQITQASTTLNGITTVLANQFQYLPLGPPSEFRLGNGIVSTRTYDQQYRPTELLDAGATPIREHNYIYDPGGNVDRLQDNILGANTQDFAQDALNRITSDSSAYGAVSYSYDAAGNRTQRKRDAVTEQTIAYTPNSNRLSQLNGVAYAYDASGNTLTDGPGNRINTYDATGRLVESRVSGVLVGTYFYNASGQRVRKIEATGAQRASYFHYGANGELLAETLYTSTNTKIAEREYIWVNELPIAFAERTFDPGTGAALTSQLAYLHTDHLGTPRLATDAAQRVVWRWLSDAFGVGAAEHDPDGDTIETNIALRFPGQYWDAEMGLHYNYFRDYDPQVGRYIQSDPIGLDGGLNTYAYVGSNPISLADPEGLQAAPWVLPRPIIVPRPVPIPTITDPPVPIPDIYPPGTTPQDPNNCDPCKGLRDQLAAHEQKLRDYTANPYAHDNLGFLGRGRDPQVIAGRIKNLEKQIENFRKLLRECVIKHGA